MMKKQKKCKVRLYLTSGKSVVVTCDYDEYDDIYDQFHARKGVMPFDQGCFHAEDVSGVGYIK